MFSKRRFKKEYQEDSSGTWLNAKKKIRREVLSKMLPGLKESSAILEFGAFASPTFDPDEGNIHFADRLSTEALRMSCEPVKRAAVVPVDYVVGENFDQKINDRFDLIIANHVIEHIPNMIGWLDRLSRLLRPSGYVFLSIPDRNYTFDIIRDLTITRELIDNFVLDRQQPSAASVLDANYFRKNISTGSDVWSGKSKKIVKIPSKIDARIFLEDVKNRIYRGDYIDAHCNVFTENSFKSIFRNLEDMGFGNLRLDLTYPVQYPYNEFYALLKKY